MTETQPELPLQPNQQHEPAATYPDPGQPGQPTTGWSGSATSRERARRDTAGGRRSRAAKRHRQLLAQAAACGATGITVKEYRDLSGEHHGVCSSDLTNLHRAGKLARLAERRDRCQVYVLPEYVNGRTTCQPRTNAHRCPHPAVVCANTESLLLAENQRLRDLLAHAGIDPTAAGLVNES